MKQQLEIELEANERRLNNIKSRGAEEARQQVLAEEKQLQRIKEEKVQFESRLKEANETEQKHLSEKKELEKQHAELKSQGNDP